MTPLPAAFICLSRLITVVGSASIRMPSGLMRARSMSTHGVRAASCSADSVWHETPCARMTPLSLAADRTSIAPAHSVVQVALCLLCSSTMSIMSMPSSRRKRSRSACALGRRLGRGLGQHDDVLPPDLADRLRDVRVGAVCVGGLEEADPLVEAVGRARPRSRRRRGASGPTRRRAPCVPLPIARRDTSMPVLPSTTRSVAVLPSPGLSGVAASGNASSRSCPRSRRRPHPPAVPARIDAASAPAAGAACRTGRSLDDAP